MLSAVSAADRHARPDDKREIGGVPVHVARFADLVEHLVRRHQREIGKHDFDDRPHPGHRHPEGKAGKPRLGNRRVQHPSGIFRREAFCGAIRPPAEIRNILPENDRLVVLLEPPSRHFGDCVRVSQRHEAAEVAPLGELHSRPFRSTAPESVFHGVEPRPEPGPHGPRRPPEGAGIHCARDAVPGEVLHTADLFSAQDPRLRQSPRERACHFPFFREGLFLFCPVAERTPRLIPRVMIAPVAERFYQAWPAAGPDVA